MRWPALILLVACHAVPGQNKTEDCTIICRCLSALPAEQDQCVTTCTTQINDSETCTTCLDENEATCATLVGTCINLCEQAPPPTGGMP